MDIGSLTFDDDYIQIIDEPGIVKVEEDIQIVGFTLVKVDQKMMQYTDRYSKRVFSYIHAV